MAETPIPSFEAKRTQTRTYDLGGNNIAAIVAALVINKIPVGTILPTLTPSLVNDGWKLLNGQHLLKAEFPSLYAVFGGTFGETETTFALPNMIGRTVFGAGGDLTLLALAGARTVTLSEAQLPSHGHAVNDPGHGHSFTPVAHQHSAPVINSLGGTGTGPGVEDGSTGDAAAGGEIGSSVTGISVGNTGGGQPIDILPPLIAVNWIVKT